MSQHEQELSERIADAEVVERFLREGAIERAFQRVEMKAFTDFKSAGTEDGLRSARALITALDELRAALRVAETRGAVAKAERERTAVKPKK